VIESYKSSVNFGGAPVGGAECLGDAVFAEVYLSRELLTMQPHPLVGFQGMEFEWLLGVKNSAVVERKGSILTACYPLKVKKRKI